ncbi:hypothetical protein DVH24_014887 [Malus domestica]|uniref:Uncharacterized protein n=1 Tax=Malus domestica TaxID=3750 RepID=A0A498K2K4_MALDO|nr:hypothetical protein DVH24_014887 [Malus domestica]
MSAITRSGQQARPARASYILCICIMNNMKPPAACAIIMLSTLCQLTLFSRHIDITADGLNQINRQTKEHWIRISALTISYISVSVIRCGSSSNTHAGVVSGNVGNRNENWQMIRVGSFSIDYKISDVPSGI